MKFFSAALILSTLAFAASARASGSPEEVLQEVNLARTQPAAYARVIADRLHGREGSRATAEAIRFLEKSEPREPLRLSSGISRAALSHVLDVGGRGGRSHYGSDGKSPFKRMAQFGRWEGYAGENIAFGQSDARDIVVTLIIDEGVRSRAHRANLFSRNFRVAGIATGRHASYGTMCVMDFASKFVEAGERAVAVQTSPLTRTYSGMSFF